MTPTLISASNLPTVELRHRDLVLNDKHSFIGEVIGPIVDGPNQGHTAVRAYDGELLWLHKGLADITQTPDHLFGRNDGRPAWILRLEPL